jgi:hypothetical protein
MPDTMIPTKAMLKLSNALCDFSDKLDDYIKASPDPYTPEMMQLCMLDIRIELNAATIGAMAVDFAAPGVLQAIADLNVQLGRAKKTREIDSAARLSLGESVLAVSTGNPLGAATVVLGLVDGIKGVIDATSAQSTRRNPEVSSPCAHAEETVRS